MDNSFTIDFENCYGISSLTHDFQFDIKDRTYVIYAGNGVMKTSFAKTFEALSKGEEPKDLIFEDRLTRCTIEPTIPAKNICVIKPYDFAYKSDKVSTLVGNEDLKQRHANANKNILDSQQELLEGLAGYSGLKENEVGNKFAFDFAVPDTGDSFNFLKSLLRIQAEVKGFSGSEFSHIKYTDIFNKHTEEILKDSDFINNIGEYSKCYENLLANSTFYKKGVFNIGQADDVAKSLKRGGYFKADHKIVIVDQGKSREIGDEAELLKYIELEKSRIINDPDLENTFQKIQKRLEEKVALQKFRDFLSDNQTIIPELIDIGNFKQKLWKSYIATNLSLQYDKCLASYNKGKEEIEEIRKAAQEENQQWDNVVAIYNERFSVPFEIKIENQINAIIHGEDPNFIFEYTDRDESKKMSKDEIQKVLSQGELRALYLLNILFEIEARRGFEIEAQEEGVGTLYIIDDIADSFDYQNKFAIIEYLSDLAKDASSRQIILTHNFDFFRTVSERLGIKKDHCIHATKSSAGIVFEKYLYGTSPFKKWTGGKSANEFIACIPLARNIADLLSKDNSKTKLTKILHQGIEKNSTTVNDIKNSLKEIFGDEPTETMVAGYEDDLMPDLIYSETEKILKLDEATEINLEEKITISIAIRLKAERFTINALKATDEARVKKILDKKNSTRNLIKMYEEKFQDKKDDIQKLKKVLLMTPQNIHINSFMFEPILDMSGYHLKKLYKAISSLE